MFRYSQNVWNDILHDLWQNCFIEVRYIDWLELFKPPWWYTNACNASSTDTDMTQLMEPSKYFTDCPKWVYETLCLYRFSVRHDKVESKIARNRNVFWRSCSRTYDICHRMLINVYEKSVSYEPQYRGNRREHTDKDCALCLCFSSKREMWYTVYWKL
jgi:hypothetical protein